LDSAESAAATTDAALFSASPILQWPGVSKKVLMPVTRDDSELTRRPQLL